MTKTEKALTWTIGIAAFLILLLGVTCLSGGILWAGWNWLVVPAFHAPRCTYLQALAAGFILSVIGSAFNRSSK